MSVLLFHTTVAPFVQQAARALHEASLLDHFYSTLVDDPKSAWQGAAKRTASLFGRDLATALRRRAVTEIPAEYVTGLPLRELLRLSAGFIDRSGRLTDLAWAWAEPGFDRAVARRLHSKLSAVYGYEYSSLATFQAARQRGLRVFYDLPAPEPAYVRRLLNQEIARFAELETPYHRHTEKREQERLERRRAEWNCADVLVTASRFTRESYAAAGLDVSRAHILPYGAPPCCAPELTLDKPNNAAPLQLLWAGTFSIRKGAHYLLDAWKKAGLGKHARLLIHGANALPASLMASLPEGIVFGGSIPRERLFDAYRSADLLVFPTLCDGFGLVATEAWSQGLPVLSTLNAGAAELLRDRENGLLVPAADSEALADALNWCLDNRPALHSMRTTALATASTWQWAHYRQALAKLVSEKLDTPKP